VKRLLASGLAVFAAHATFASTLKVVTQSGALVGEASTGLHVFKGVPYAQPAFVRQSAATAFTAEWRAARTDES
jgi:carboxylesterase type B